VIRRSASLKYCRRTRTLPELSAGGLEAQTVEDALQRCARALADAAFDLPFALFYRLDEDQRSAELIAHTGLAPGGPASPTRIDLTHDHAWPFERVLASGASLQLDDIRTRFPGLTCGPYPEPIESARIHAILPSRHGPGHKPPALLVTGMSTRHRLRAPGGPRTGARARDPRDHPQAVFNRRIQPDHPPAAG
jgi:hypothetical protein